MFDSEPPFGRGLGPEHPKGCPERCGMQRHYKQTCEQAYAEQRPAEKRCLICKAVLPFKRRHWPTRYAELILCLRNTQPRCRPCDLGYRKRCAAFNRTKKMMVEAGIDHERLSKSGNVYFKKIVLNATRLSVAQVMSIENKLFETFAPESPHRPEFEVARYNRAQNKVAQNDDPAVWTRAERIISEERT